MRCSPREWHNPSENTQVHDPEPEEEISHIFPPTFCYEKIKMFPRTSPSVWKGQGASSDCTVPVFEIKIVDLCIDDTEVEVRLSRQPRA